MAERTRPPTLGSYTDACGSVSSHCECRVTTMPRGVVVVVPCDGHAGAVVVEMRARERASAVAVAVDAWEA